MDNKIFEAISDLELLALCVYGEARNQGLDGMLAVASVIVNRANNPCWWGSDIKGVILKAYQFSCLNEKDPNRKMLESIALDFKGGLERFASLKSCYWVAKGIIEGFLTGNIKGATHYHTKAISPEWKEKMSLVKQVGDHLFYV